MKIIYINLVWFALLIIGIINAAIGRHTSEVWEGMTGARSNYNFLYAGIGLLLLTSIVGILLKRKWGYELTLSANSTMTLLPLSIFCASFFLLPSYSTIEIITLHATNLTIGLISLFFWVYQVRSGIKAKYVQSM